MAEKIIIASGKGGAGKSSLTAGLACKMRAKGLRVLVVDFDIGQGCVDFMLGAGRSTVYNWGDALTGGCRASATLNEASGISFVSAPLHSNEGFSEDKMKDYIKNFDPLFDYILFDSPAGVGEGFSLAAACADRGIIVSTPDEVCVRAASAAAQELIKKGVEDLRLVINRFDAIPVTRGRFYNIDEVIDATSLQLIGVVPEDKEIGYAAQTGFNNLKDCSAKAAYGRIADRIRGLKVRLVLTPTKKERERMPFAAKCVLCFLAAVLAVIILITGADLISFAAGKAPAFCVTVSENETQTEKRGILYKYSEERENGEKISCKMEIFGKTALERRSDEG